MEHNAYENINSCLNIKIIFYFGHPACYLSPSPSFTCEQMALLATYPDLTQPLGRVHLAYSLSPHLA